MDESDRAVGRPHDVRSLIDEVGLGEHAKGPFALRVYVRCHLKDLLRCNIHIGGNDREHDGPRVLHIAQDYAANEHYIGLGHNSQSDSFEDARDVDNCWNTGQSAFLSDHSVRVANGYTESSALPFSLATHAMRRDAMSYGRTSRILGLHASAASPPYKCI